MRTMQVQVYKLSELSEEAQQNAIEKQRQSMYEDQWYAEELSDDFKRQLEERGFYDCKVFFSLSNCQGDGVAFESNIDVSKFFKYHKLEKDYELLLRHADLYITVRHDGRYYHWNSMNVEVHSDWDLEEYDDDDPRYYAVQKIEEELEELTTRLEEHIQEIVQDTSKEFEKQGYAYFDDVYSDESVKEHIEANEYEFDEEGDMI